MTSLEELHWWSPWVIYYVSKRGESCEAIQRKSDVGVSLYVICKMRFIVWSREHNTKHNTIFMKNRLGLASAERFGEGKLHTVSSIACS